MPNGKRLSDAEREQRRAEDRRRLDEAARQLLSSEGWQRCVRVRARNGLSRYSLSNQLLIVMARPDATFVAGFRAWLELGYCVRKGERAIRIMAPMPMRNGDGEGDESEDDRSQRLLFKAVSVFDAAQVAPLPSGEPTPLGPPSEPLAGDSHAGLLEALRAFAASIGFRVSFEALSGSAGGWCDAKAKRIVVDAGMRGNAQVRVLVPWRKGRIPTFGMLSRDRCRVVVRAGRSEARYPRAGTLAGQRPARALQLLRGARQQRGATRLP
jgi:hypothetical protein